MYKIFMIVGITVVGCGWIAYWVYNHIMDKREKQQPRRSEHLKKANETMAEYAKKMANFKKKSYEKQQ
jgi:predicted nucleotide-binding protein (sugar kinase/HSP70/actin superfamily)